MNTFEYLKKNEAKSLKQLKEFLKIPSVSSQSIHKEDMRKCSLWVCDFLKKLSIKSEILETGGHPIVFGEYNRSDDVPTLLIYGHYDVQPVEPLSLWESDPFDPIEKNGYIFARGATDDKGQMFTHLKATEAYLKTSGSIPINIKFLIEGEEETSSENLDTFIKKNREKLKADIALISDGTQYGPDMPAISYGLRGIAFVEIKITGPDRDLHSGSYGGAVANPINVLCEIISKLHDKNGHIAIDGFYKNVIPLKRWEKEQLLNLPFNKAKYIASIGSPKLWGERGFSTLEQTRMRPTLDCNGITGGYQEDGVKTIIPSWASTKITMRLVPNQTPDEICNKIGSYIKKICPNTVKYEIKKHGGALPIKFPFKGPWIKAAERAIKIGFGKKPYFTGEGGSIPVVETFKTVLGFDTLLIGFGQNDDNAHSSNEKFFIRDFHRGCCVSVALFKELSKIKINHNHS